jgi:hypothetical protein
MTTDNRRTEEQSEAKTEESRENFVPLLNGAMVDKVGRDESFLPGSNSNAYVATIERAV